MADGRLPDNHSLDNTHQPKPPIQEHLNPIDEYPCGAYHNSAPKCASIPFSPLRIFRKRSLTSAVPVEKMNHSQKLLLALGMGVLIGAARWVLECRFVAPLVGSDPQIPIWIMVSTVTSIIIAMTIALAAWLFLHGLRSKSKLLKSAAGLPFLLLLGWYSTGFANLYQIRSALLDSANPKTDAARLRELANFKNGPGYEIDNRIAKNPNTPPDVLRSLHGRPDQVGTEMCLAANPNTPDDILHSIAKLAEKKSFWSQYYLDALKRNPRYEGVFNTKERVGTE